MFTNATISNIKSGVTTISVYDENNELHIFMASSDLDRVRCEYDNPLIYKDLMDDNKVTLPLTINGRGAIQIIDGFIIQNNVCHTTGVMNKRDMMWATNVLTSFMYHNAEEFKRFAKYINENIDVEAKLDPEDWGDIGDTDAAYAITVKNGDDVYDMMIAKKSIDDEFYQAFVVDEIKKN